jgi:signal transduction histidine kinase
MPSGISEMNILAQYGGWAAAVLSVVFATFAWVYRARWRRAEEALPPAEQRAEAAEVALSAAPLGCLAFSHLDGTIQASPRLIETLELSENQPTVALSGVLSAFEDASARKLSISLEALLAQGGGFSHQLRAADGARTFDVTGARAHAADGAAAVDFVWFHDTTSSVDALAQARAERGALAAILDTLPLPVWRRDEDLNLVYCNAAYARAVDAQAPDAVSQAIELLGKAKSDSAQALARRAVQNQAPANESHHVVIDGARRLLEIGECPIGDGTLVGHAVDRTDAEDLAGELKRHVGAHDDVLENLGSAIAIFGKDFRLRFFNTAYARLWHLEESFLSTEPALGDILEVLREQRRLPEHPNFPEYKRDWIRGLQTMIDTTEELVHLPDGTTLRSLASPHPFGGVLFVYEDVTDRLTLERSYNTLIEVQRETLDNLYEGIAVFGADGRLKLFNPAYSRIWNLASDLLDQKPHVRQLLDQGRSYFEGGALPWDDYVESRAARATEAEPRGGRRTRADDSVIDWAQVPLPDGASLFTFLDVTDSNRVERALRDRNDALETADRLKSEFVANISYELRTPLNAIVGFAEILENQFFGALNERQLEYSRGIVEASQRLIALINDILDLATIEAGYMELDLGPVEVKGVLESIQTLGHERARSQNISLRVDCPEDIGVVTADGRRLRQALFNLLSNAFKFTPDGGSVTVSAVRTDSEIQFVVSDSGVGISEEDLGRVFGKFERGTLQAGQGGQSGAGLGLSLVKSLIELHGGRVDLRSTPQEGTQVVCHVPLHAAGEATTPLGATA